VIVTEELYHRDAYQRRFEAHVVAREAESACLDRTAFYPGGGGQPEDRGQIHYAGGTVQLAGSKRRGSAIWHKLTGDPPQVGDEVEGELDWVRRYQLMRTHTAMHILCGVIWRDYGASVTGGNMKPLSGRMDFEFEHMTKELVAEIEEKINREVAEARPVQSAILPRAEAFEIPDLIRTKINLLPEHIQQVRVVEIVGLDLQADGGTHVKNTSEVGPINIVDYKSKGAINKRIVLSLQA
jgi:misacylated tRNA(Ala) deacylase